MLKVRNTFNDGSEWKRTVKIDSGQEFLEVIDAIYSKSIADSGDAYNITVSVKADMVEISAVNYSNTIGLYAKIPVMGITGIDNELLFRLDMEDENIANLPPNADTSASDVYEVILDVRSSPEESSLTITPQTEPESDVELSEEAITTTPKDAKNKVFDSRVINEVIDGGATQTLISLDKLSSILPTGERPSRSNKGRLSTSETDLLVESFTPNGAERHGAWMQSLSAEAACRPAGPVRVAINKLTEVNELLLEYDPQPPAQFSFKKDGHLVIKKGRIIASIAHYDNEGIETTDMKIQGFGETNAGHNSD